MESVPKGQEWGMGGGRRDWRTGFSVDFAYKTEDADTESWLTPPGASCRGSAATTEDNAGFSSAF